jgi:quercetin dioxygenase-like cupin family protein
VSYLKLKKKTRCSWHSHQSKWNLFVLIGGKVEIITKYDTVLLDSPGASFTIPPGVEHEFRALEVSDMIEEMYVEYDEGDIFRANEGSVL